MQRGAGAGEAARGWYVRAFLPSPRVSAPLSSSCARRNVLELSSDVVIRATEAAERGVAKPGVDRHGGVGRHGCHGGGRDRGCIFDYGESQHSGLYFHEAIALPSGNQMRGSISDAIRFICYFHIFLPTLQ